ncbi:hypothetical protein B0H65DRAFT_441814 [Neurospora tetraspora]|uniref:Uncharacterized protein n=1 Tax=Neurospora tetraspora TaxID=94610 RepID=A0AAE0JIH6_9PEZI|nr:hypothetical protein B0H65DRAFT_441814 [Neurospora tetraspora]
MNLRAVPLSTVPTLKRLSCIFIEFEEEESIANLSKKAPKKATPKKAPKKATPKKKVAPKKAAPKKVAPKNKRKGKAPALEPSLELMPSLKPETEAEVTSVPSFPLIRLAPIEFSSNSDSEFDNDEEKEKEEEEEEEEEE